MFNLDIPLVELFVHNAATISYSEQTLHFFPQNNPEKVLCVKPGTCAAFPTEKVGPSHVWIIPKMTYPSRASLSLAGHFLFRSHCQRPKKDLHLINLLYTKDSNPGTSLAFSTCVYHFDPQDSFCAARVSSAATEHTLFNTLDKAKAIFCITHCLLKPQIPLGNTVNWTHAN